MKKKPTQYAVSRANAAGIQPDFIIARAQKPLDQPRKNKLSVFCNLKKENIISAPDVKNVLEVPINFEKDKLSDKILKELGLQSRVHKMPEWSKKIRKFLSIKKAVKIGIVGKYFASGDFILPDSYISVIEAIKQASFASGVVAEIGWIDSDMYEKNPSQVRELDEYQGIIVPGGFGKRGVEGKIRAIRYAREKGIPYLGLCYGMQLASIEFARNVCGMKNANTTEIDPNTKFPIIHIMQKQVELLKNKQYGNTMRLGAWPCVLDAQSKSFKAYKTRKISERHRHRYEFNNEYRKKFEKAGMSFAGLSPDKELVEIIELKNHPFFIGTQFHPEFKSRILNPHPLFKGFIEASIKRKTEIKF